MPEEEKISWVLRFRQSNETRRQRRKLRREIPPWILQHCPESIRRIVVVLFTILGAFSFAVIALAIVLGIIYAPIIIASGRSGSLLQISMTRYFHWLQTHLPTDSFFQIYVLIQIGAAFILSYFVSVFTWLVKRDFRVTSPQEKSEVANDSPVPPPATPGN